MMQWCRSVRILGAFACFAQSWWLIIYFLYTQQIFVGRLSNIYHIETGINKYLTQREVSQLKTVILSEISLYIRIKIFLTHNRFHRLENIRNHRLLVPNKDWAVKGHPIIGKTHIFLVWIVRMIWFFAEDRPYNCEICKKGFVSKTQLVTHFRRYHHDLGAHQVDKLLNFMLVSKNLKAS